jgi:hypothetical protein
MIPSIELYESAPLFTLHHEDAAAGEAKGCVSRNSSHVQRGFTYLVLSRAKNKSQRIVPIFPNSSQTL